MFVLLLVTDFSAEDKADGVKFCTAVHRHPRQGISHFGELCLIGLYLQLMLMHLNKDLISIGNFKILYTIF